MSIFLIKPKEEVKESTDTNAEVSSENPSQPDPSTPASSDDSLINQISEDKTSVDPSLQKDIDEKSIVLDGPLSQVYTEALNQMYAKEAYVTEIQAIQKKQVEEDVEKWIGDADSYLYVIDGPYLELHGTLDAFEDIQKALENFKHVYVCIEHQYNVTDRVAGFITYAREAGCTIILSRDHALEMIHTRIS